MNEIVSFALGVAGGAVVAYLFVRNNPRFLDPSKLSEKALATLKAKLRMKDDR